MNTFVVPVSPGLPRVPGDLQPGQGRALVGGVVALHVALAAVVLTRAPAPPLQPAPLPIQVALLSAAAEAPPPEPLPTTLTPPAPVSPPRRVAPAPTPPVLSSRQPAAAHDMVVPPPAPAADVRPVSPVQTPAVAEPPNPAPVTPAVEAPQPPAPPKVMASSDADYLVRPPLAFPRVSRELGESGTVRLRVLVGEDGRPREIEVAKSSGFSRLDQAAITAMRAARFKPYLEAGVARPRWVLTPLTFNLEEQ